MISRNVAFGLGTAAYCTGLGLTIAGAYYLGTTTDCNNDATCLKERVAGIAMTAIGVTAFVGSTAFLCCYSFLTGAADCCGDILKSSPMNK